MEIKTHRQIRDHFEALKRQLHWKNKDVAEFLGVRPQTVYMYAFDPETKGSRRIPLYHLEALRTQAIEKHYEFLDEGCFNPFGKEINWHINGISTRIKQRAIYEVAINGGTIEAAGGNPLPVELDDDEMAIFKWLQAKANGSLYSGKMI